MYPFSCSLCRLERISTKRNYVVVALFYLHLMNQNFVVDLKIKGKLVFVEIT